MNSNGGFTLIELILVTVIIAILAGMIVPMFGGRVQESQIRAAKGDIASLSNAVDLYALDHNDQYPQSLQALVSGDRNYIRELRNDPWGNPYIYVPPKNMEDVLKANYKIYSAGPNGNDDGGSGDDVTSTSALPGGDESGDGGGNGTETAD